MPLLIFDFDGTLADTRTAIVETMKVTVERMGFSTPDDDAVKNVIGLPLKECIIRVSGMSDEEAEKGVVLYRELFMGIAVKCASLFPGVLDVIKTLSERGVPMAIATSRSQASLEGLVEMLGLKPYITHLYGDGHVKRGKPAPDLAEFIVNDLGADPGQTLVIGDTTYDIEMGNGAGCYTCAVTYGNHTREQLATANPTYIIDDLKAIL